jgi:asparagine synthase (glutamine-hydrolysing)
MCGITGFYGFEDKELLKRMTSALTYRGPDDFGYYSDKLCSLGHRRLSIIDLSKKGKQPMSNEDGSIFITFNGEIYNFKDIRVELEKNGHRFRSNTDTEVIVHAFEEYGVDCLKRFNGMFAFAIWDSSKKRLFLARDRLGIKPLYYYFDKELIFGSELKAVLASGRIRKKLDMDALNHFFAYEYVPSPYSIIKNVKKLLPGHYLVLDKGTLSVKKYWDIIFEGSNHGKDYYLSKIPELLQDSIKKRLISDVPLGAFLSGGIDSSSIVALMSQVTDNVKTFSIGFEQESYSEADDARIVAEKFNTEHHEKILKPEELMKLLDTVVKNVDEPFGDLSIFPTYLVSKFARRHVTVVLSGDGGDELFAGYDWYLADKLHKYYRLVPGQRVIFPRVLKRFKQTPKSKGFVNKAKRFTEGALMPSYLRHHRWMTSFDYKARENIYSRRRELQNPFEMVRALASNVKGNLNKMQYVDIKTYLPDDILTKVDRASMYNSLEARVPFLDHNFVEFAARIPQSLKLKGVERKYILKKAMSKYLPKGILYKGKQGFTMPMKHWLRGELKGFMNEVLSERKIREIGILNPDYVNKIIKQHLSKRRDNQRHIWAMMNFHIWYKNYMQA